MQQRAKKSHYQSKVFACVSNNREDAVVQALIYILEQGTRLRVTFPIRIFTGFVNTCIFPI